MGSILLRKPTVRSCGLCAGPEGTVAARAGSDIRHQNAVQRKLQTQMPIGNLLPSQTAYSRFSRWQWCSLAVCNCMVDSSKCWTHSHGSVLWSVKLPAHYTRVRATDTVVVAGSKFTGMHFASTDAVAKASRLRMPPIWQHEQSVTSEIFWFAGIGLLLRPVRLCSG